MIGAVWSKQKAKVVRCYAQNILLDSVEGRRRIRSVHSDRTIGTYIEVISPLNLVSFTRVKSFAIFE